MNSENSSICQAQNIPKIIGRPFLDPNYKILRIKIICPFCGQVHFHGGTGKRLSHCRDAHGQVYFIRAQIGAHP